MICQHSVSTGWATSAYQFHRYKVRGEATNLNTSSACLENEALRHPRMSVHTSKPWLCAIMATSAVYTRNSIGPKTIPCRTPQRTADFEDTCPATTITCVRSAKLLIHDRTIPSIPNAFRSRSIRMLSSTVSNAADISPELPPQRNIRYLVFSPSLLKGHSPLPDHGNGITYLRTFTIPFTPTDIKLISKMRNVNQFCTRNLILKPGGNIAAAQIYFSFASSDQRDLNICNLVLEVTCTMIPKQNLQISTW